MTVGWTPYLLLSGLSLALFLPGIGAIPPIDRDEARFAQASRQMLESGDYVRIQFQTEVRAKKPVGIYWLQAAAVSLTGDPGAIWAYRLPSVIGGVAAVLLTFFFGRTLVGGPAALIGAALLASSVLLVSEAHQAKTDAVLLACVVAAQGVLGRFYLAGRGAAARPGNGVILAFWLAQGLGILVKGPIVPLISLLTIVTLWIADRRIGWLTGIRPVVGLILVAAMVGPWAAAVSTATQGQFLGQAIRGDLIPKLLGAQESHGAPPGTYLLLMTATLWPAALFAVPGLVRAIALRHAPAVRFCLAWIVPAWLLFEAVPTKLPHYVLPTYPVLALLAGLAVAAEDGWLQRRWVRPYALLCGLAATALAAALVIAPRRWGNGDGAWWWFLPPALVALAAGWAPVAALWRNRPQAAWPLAVAAAVLTYGAVFAVVLPRLDRLWISRTVAQCLPAGTPLAAAGFHEPSLVFLMGTTTKLTDGAGAAQFLAETPDAAALVEQAAEPDFAAALATLGRSAQVIASFDGFNYSRGHAARLSLWRLDGPP